jgi:hypothetical protein
VAWINPPKRLAGESDIALVVAVEAVDPVGNSPCSGELSTSPQILPEKK